MPDGLVPSRGSPTIAYTITTMSLLVIFLFGGCREDRCQNGRIKIGDFEDSAPNAACGDDTLTFSPCKANADDISSVAIESGAGGAENSGNTLEVSISLKSALGEARPRTVQEVFFCSTSAKEEIGAGIAGGGTDVADSTSVYDESARDCRNMQSTIAEEHPFANATFDGLADQSAVGKCHKSSASRIACLTDANGRASFSIMLSPGTKLIHVCSGIDDDGPVSGAGGAHSKSQQGRFAVLEILPTLPSAADSEVSEATGGASPVCAPACALPELNAGTAGVAGAAGGAI